MPWAKNKKPQGLPRWGTGHKRYLRPSTPATLTPLAQAGELGVHDQVRSPILTDEKRKDTEAKQLA